MIVNRDSLNNISLCILKYALDKLLLANIILYIN